MPDEPVVTPAVVQAPATPAAAPAAPPPPASVTSGEPLPAVGEPGWLKQRIDRATEDGEKKAKRALKDEKKAARAAADEAKAARSTADAEVAAAVRAVEAILIDVPEAERAALKAAAGGNQAKTLELFAAWKLAKGSIAATPAPTATPAAIAPPVTDPAAPAAPAPVAAPATTAAAAAAPPPPVPGAGEDHRANYDALKQSNPYLASQYLLNHQDEIYPVRTFDQVTQQRRT